MIKILIGEIDRDLADAMRDWFAIDKIVSQVETNGLPVLDWLRKVQYDMILLNVRLPGVDGISIVKQYRASGGHTPIILMAGRHCSEELQRGLDLGADSYLVQPFQLGDLSAKVRAALRRPELQGQKLLRTGSLVLHAEAGVVTRDDKPIHLHPMEFKLLHFLMKHPNQIFDAGALAERVWQKSYHQGDETVRTHISTLRRKLDAIGQPSVVTTVRGLGYKSEKQPLHFTA